MAALRSGLPGRRRLVILLAVAMAPLAPVRHATAGDTAWSGTASGAWSDPANWSAGVPSASGTSHAFLDDSSAPNKTIILPGDATSSQLIATGSGFTLTTGSLALDDQLYVVGSGGDLTLSGGAVVTTPSGFVGLGAGESGNALSVGATLSVTDTFRVGYEATSNVLRITSGGSMAAHRLWIGDRTSGTGNSVSIAAGATLTSGSQVVVGLEGGANTITSSGVVSAQQTIIGGGTTAGGNVLSILAGGTWTSAGTLLVGNAGSANVLQVAAGAAVRVTGAATDIVVGQAASAAGNGITIDGGSLSGSATLYVGGAGTGNSLLLQNGATVTERNVRLGRDATSTGNSVTVDGAGTTLGITNKLRVGNDGGGNAFVVRNGGQVTVASDIFVGGYTNGSNVSNNAITVTGSGSTLTMSSGDLVIAYGTGTNNTVTVTNGGQLAVSSVRLGPAGRLVIGTGSAAGSVSPTAVINAPSGGGAVVFNHDEAAYAFANAITGSTSILQLGTGRTVINGTANTYTGKTIVSAGTLALAGATSPIASSNAIEVASGAFLDVGGVLGGFALANGQTLAGKGTVSGAVTTGSASTVAPGLGDIGTLSFDSNLTVQGLLALDVSGTAADAILVSGTLNVASSALDFTVGSQPTQPVYVLATYTSLYGQFASVNNLPAGYQIDYAYGGNTVALVSVPEPGGFVLVAGGGCGAVELIRRRRRRRLRPPD